ncbi:MFS transporter [Streptomyces sp. SID3343]|uniref:MFS transporter n=1 Tax=Streptomyces sp. SID3343 TaxID=2690260 RepID=UPI00136B5640|nr:MFS transporter [Streptomyces sp. SID3343]MYW03199.1 MFS transporter [Streptomyces sp. SID3343]
MVRIAAASFAGTSIEFYDFFVYGTAAALVLGPLFFPGFSPIAGTLAAFATYAVGFIARPLGSVVFGHIGDRRGRRPVLVASLLLTGIATVLVGLLPTYDRIGIAAPILLVLLRFCQGFGVGGEWGGAVLLAAEHAPPGKRGLWASFPQIGPAVGFLLANTLMLVLSGTLTDGQFRAWGWRVPFVFAGVLVAVGLMLRSSVEETPQFRELAAADELSQSPFRDVVRHHWRLILLCAGAMTSGYVAFYLTTTWSLHYGTTRLDVGRTTMLACIMVAVVVKGVCTPLFALLGDRHGRRSLCLVGCSAMGLWAFPMLGLLATGEPMWITLACVGTLIAFIVTFSGVGAYLSELFEPRVRCTGASTAYNLGGVLGGALTPIVATELARGDGTPWGVAAYLVGAALLSVACFAALPETRVALASDPSDPGNPGNPEAVPA